MIYSFLGYPVTAIFIFLLVMATWLLSNGIVYLVVKLLNGSEELQLVMIKSSGVALFLLVLSGVCELGMQYLFYNCNVVTLVCT